MKRLTETINIVTVVIALLMALAILILSLCGCSDTAEKPTQPDPIDTLYNQPIDINTPTAFQINQIANKPKVTTHVPKPDPALKDVPKPTDIIDVDTLIGKGAIELNREMGSPIEVVGNAKSSIRHYDLFDGNMAVIILADDVIVNIQVFFQRGYDTSKEALNAVGFQDEHITFVKHTPRKEINGVAQTAIDSYTVKTDNNQFDNVDVSQNRHNVWDIVAITM